MINEIPMTLFGAFQHFLDNNCPSPIPKEVNLAKHDRDNPKRGLGHRRIEKILEKYAPGKYRFVVEVFLNPEK